MKDCKCNGQCECRLSGKKKDGECCGGKCMKKGKEKINLQE